MAAISVQGLTKRFGSVTAVEDLSFDVPPGTQPAELEVHDSMFSGGAKVRL